MSKQRPVVAVLVGSLRKGSFNRQLARALEETAGDRAEFRHIRIDDLPLYNQDFDADYPAVCKRMKDEIKTCDAVLFVTPEYNRSIPGVLKNAIDIASRPWGTNSFASKPGAVIGTSMGAMSTALAQQHLRNVCVFLDVPMLQQPEAFVRYKEGLITDDGSVTDEGVGTFLGNFVDKYLDWVSRFV
ncbi:MAG: NAD(P)H-dependent oxidoreductase [Xanthomonadaceae bacterium]|nr:NAD(P)H-dependent oxidoreductase [Xanthomonadaceae bacterium]MDE2223858.1 NAD(P)H-dependent oxidoreductase [Xanthomonadaceae bacterium]